jgi:hypothetical protein
VIALVFGESEQTLFQDRIATVPECRREAENLPIVADARESVLAPSIRLPSTNKVV